MATNPYRTPLTKAQHACVDRGRQALLERWRSNSALRNGQPSNTRIEFRDEELDGTRVCDVFDVAPASPSFSNEWRAEIDRYARYMSVEHATRAFVVRVDQTYYSAQRMFPMSIDVSCVSATISQCVLGVALLVAAAYIGSGNTMHDAFTFHSA